MCINRALGGQGLEENGYIMAWYIRMCMVMARKSSLFQSSERFLALEEVLRWLKEVLKWLKEVLK